VLITPDALVTPNVLVLNSHTGGTDCISRAGRASRTGRTRRLKIREKQKD